MDKKEPTPAKKAPAAANVKKAVAAASKKATPAAKVNKAVAVAGKKAPAATAKAAPAAGDDACKALRKKADSCS